MGALRLLAGLARLYAAEAARRAAITSALVGCALLCALIGLTGFAVALWIWLARIMDPALAALLIGGVAFLIAAILLLIARSQKPRRVSVAPELAALLAGLKAREDMLEVWTPLIGLALLGFLVGGKGKD